ncbi:hypothetical protein [Streptomyces tendae]|uniref:hypothetical protein n=1 Tax=Streptomyces tendae TaxID=1932 RepID=UPI003676FF7A
MGALRPVPPPVGVEGLDYIDLQYPVANITTRFTMRTHTFPPRTSLSAHEQAVLGAVAVEMARRHALFYGPVTSLLEGQHAAVHGHHEVVAHVARHTLGIRGVNSSQWREAASMALMGDWVPMLHDDDAGLLIPRHVKREAERTHTQLQPLWEHKVKGRPVALLDAPTTDGLTLGDLAADTVRPYGSCTDQTINDPRAREVLAALDPDERDVALLYVRDSSVRSWTEAARRSGAANPKQFGERVRRRLLRLGDRQRKHGAAGKPRSAEGA